MTFWNSIFSLFANKPTTVTPKEAFMESCKVIGNGIRSELDGPTGKKVFELMLINWPISDISNVLTKDIIEFVYRESLCHARLTKDIQKELIEKYSHLTNEQAKTIVLSVASKANAVFDRIRQENCGINWYQWSTCCDSRVRPSHKKMEGVLVPWSDPPSPEELIGKTPIGKYHAGEGIECRCCALAVTDIEVELGQIKFPRRVYWHGQIQVMKKSEFLKIY